MKRDKNSRTSMNLMNKQKITTKKLNFRISNMRKRERSLCLIDCPMFQERLKKKWSIFVRFGKMGKYFSKSNNVWL